MKNISNQQFGFFYCTPRWGHKNNIIFWLCKCICGKEVWVNGATLRNGSSKSCGCKSRELFVQTNLDRYGCENPLQCESIIQKQKNTVKEKYGVDNISQLPEIRKKAANTSLERYGVEYVTQSAEFRDQIKQTNIERYGCEYPIQDGDILKKQKQTNLEKYGKESVSQVKEFRDKVEQTNLDKYGFKTPFQSPEIKEIIKQNCLEKYGHEQPMHNAEIALKHAKSTNKSTIMFHWLTGEEVVCVGSYESKTVKYLNENKINFKWQPEIFKLSTGKTYRPDLYLIKEDKWIEIKGYFRKDALEKWEEFITIKPNSELWNQQKLKELGIL